MPDRLLLPRRPFFYLRHGQTDWNVEGRCQGQTDIPMNEAGEAEVAASVGRLPLDDVTHIVSSPLLRAHRSAQLAAARLGLPVTVDEGLKEAFWGEAEGRTDTRWRPAWCEGETLYGAEPFAAFSLRVVAAVTRVVSQPGVPLIVAHGGVYWAIERALGRDGLSHLPNGTLLKHVPRDGGGLWRVTFV